VDAVEQPALAERPLTTASERLSSIGADRVARFLLNNNGAALRLEQLVAA
jgi:hypothetical protein